jgi:tetratricopeptide (TPR) repeat protein
MQLACAAAWLALANLGVSAAPAPAPEGTALSAWRQINDGYYADEPSLVVSGLKQLDALKGNIAAGTFAYVRAYGLFRLVSVSNRKDQAQARLEEADQLLAKPPADGAVEFHALRSAVDGELAGLGSMVLAIQYGPAAQAEADRALRLESTNGRALLFWGQIKGSTPEQYGGSPAEAIERLQAATAALGSHPTDGIYNWGEADAYAWLGIFYRRQKDPAKARIALGAALQARPDFYWVREILLPKLEGKPAHPKFPKNQATE